MWRTIDDNAPFPLRAFWFLAGLLVGGAFYMALKAWQRADDFFAVEDEPVEAGIGGIPDTPEVIRYLRTNLGYEITAFISGVDDLQAVQAWAEGMEEPPLLAAERLRLAYEATQLIVDAYGSETAATWFFAMSPVLNDVAPAYVLRHGSGVEDWRAVLPAAVEFVET